MDNLAIFFLCGIPFLLISTVALFVREHRRHKNVTTELEEKLSVKNKQMGALKTEFNRLKADSLYGVRRTWLATVSKNTYRNEIEVEVKFVAPLLSHLGFHENSLDVRRSVSVQVGRNRVQGEADWVAWNAQRTKPLLIVEAKGPNQPLDSSVKEQARSYANALNGISYMLVNGKNIIMYERGLHDDKCIVDCSVADLLSHWDEIVSSISISTALSLQSYNETVMT